MGLEKEQHEGFIVFIFNSLPTLDFISFMRMLILPFILNDIVPRIKISPIVSVFTYFTLWRPLPLNFSITAWKSPFLLVLSTDRISIFDYIRPCDIYIPC